MLSITVNNLKKPVAKIETDCRKATKAGMENLAKKTAWLLRENIANSGAVWRGNLFNSVKVTPDKKSELNIKMNFYGRFVDKGHKISPGTKLPLLRAWANEKLGENADNWMSGVYTKGHYVKPRNFVQDTINAIEPQVDSEIVFKLNKVK